MDFENAARKAARWFVPAAAVIVALSYITKWLPDGVSKLGTLGDAFAPVTGFFSCIAVLLTVEALKKSQTSIELSQKALDLAQRTLELQIEELRQNREALEGQRDAQIDQAAQLKRSNDLSLLASTLSVQQLEGQLLSLIGSGEAEHGLTLMQKLVALPKSHMFPWQSRAKKMIAEINQLKTQVNSQREAGYVDEDDKKPAPPEGEAGS